MTFFFEGKGVVQSGLERGTEVDIEPALPDGEPFGVILPEVVHRNGWSIVTLGENDTGQPGVGRSFLAAGRNHELIVELLPNRPVGGVRHERLAVDERHLPGCLADQRGDAIGQSVDVGEGIGVVDHERMPNSQECLASIGFDPLFDF